MCMFGFILNFAHNGVDHATTTETVSHASPAIVGVTVLALIVLAVIARLLSREPKKEKGEE